MPKDKLHFRQNPLNELIDDDTFDLLNSKKLINKNSVRNYEIRRQFWEMRREDIRAGDAIDRLHKKHPYLQYDSIRKIVYKKVAFIYSW